MSGAFTGSGGSVVTTGTGAGDTGVIKIHGGPVSGDMTIITHIAGR